MFIYIYKKNYFIISINWMKVINYICFIICLSNSYLIFINTFFKISNFKIFCRKKNAIMFCYYFIDCTIFVQTCINMALNT